MNAPHKIRILLVEDHFLARLALRTLIEGQSDMEVVGQAESGRQAVTLYGKHQPTLVVMDLRLPEVDGTAATALIRQLDPAARVLVLSNHDGDAEVALALQAGAGAFLKKDVDGVTLLDAIRQVARGETFLPKALAERMAAMKPQPQLSPREVEILQLIFEGKSNQEIAEQLSLSLGTIRIHVSNILFKMNVKRRTEAIAAGLKSGLLRAG